MKRPVTAGFRLYLCANFCVLHPAVYLLQTVHQYVALVWGNRQPGNKTLSSTATAQFDKFVFAFPAFIGCRPYLYFNLIPNNNSEAIIAINYCKSRFSCIKIHRFLLYFEQEVQPCFCFICYYLPIMFSSVCVS